MLVLGAQGFDQRRDTERLGFLRRQPPALANHLLDRTQAERRAGQDLGQPAVDRWLAEILACAPLSLRAIKQMVRQGGRLSPQEAQALRVPALVEALRSEDQHEGVRAFQEKRAPVWQGR